MSRSKRPKGSAVPSASRRRVQATEGERSAQRQQAAGALHQVRNRFANANLFP